MILGAAIVVSVAGQSAASAQPVSGPYELYCPGTPVGNIALNDVVTTGTLSPSDPSAGQTFSLTGYQTTVTLPSAIVSAAAALGNSAIVGTASTTVDVIGATPATTPVGPIDINAPIPSPVPGNGLELALPSTPDTLGPFTATSSAITIEEDPSASLSLDVSGSTLNLTCDAYPNNSAATGIVSGAPGGSPITPVIAEGGGGSNTTTTTQGTSTTTTPSEQLTGAYELYCPGTPVGNVVLNDAVTSATLSPPDPSAGQAFSLTGYQTLVNLPASLASAAAAVEPNLEGTATTQIDATGATPATTAEPSISFNVPIPSPVPIDGVSLSLPSTAATVSGFTATGGSVAIEEDEAASLTLTVANSPLTLTCTAYPNDSVTPSGITTTTPTAAPIAPVIAASQTGPPPTTTTTEAGGTTTTTAPLSVGLTGAYELYCPGTPVGDVVLNDAVTSATLSPAVPTVGQSFSVNGYQTVVNLPAALAGAAQALQPNLEGTATTQIDASGASPVTTAQGPFDFNVPIPVPVPASGVALSLPSTPATIGGFTASAGSITIEEDASASLSLTVANSPLTLTCTAYPNDMLSPSGITTSTPTASPIDPVIAVAQAGPPPTTTTTASTTTTTTGSSTTTTASPTSTTTTTPKTTTTTAAPKTTTTSSASGGGGTSAASTTTASPVQTASSGSLAFTGPGQGIKSITLAGVALMLLGLVLLLLVDVPRRALRSLASVGAGLSSAPGAGRVGHLAASAARRGQRFTRWLFGRGDD
jgi:hypothetical protein